MVSNWALRIILLVLTIVSSWRYQKSSILILLFWYCDIASEYLLTFTGRVWKVMILKFHNIEKNDDICFGSFGFFQYHGKHRHICTKVTSFPRLIDATYGCGCSSLSLHPTEDQAWPKDQQKYWWPAVLALSLLAHMVIVWKSFLSYYVQDF